MKKLYALPAIVLLFSMLLGSRLALGQKYFTADVQGHGKPVILIHGLYCSGEVWRETVNHYKDKYECHIITLSGFGGNPPNLNDNFLQSVKDDIIGYVKTKNLKKPTLIGHSMGAFLALWAASSAPGTFENVIAVDGAPFISALMLPGSTAESAKPMALQYKQAMAGQTPEQIRQQQLAILPGMITDQKNIEQVANIAAKADSKTQAEVMYEMFTTDLRPAMATVDCPVLVLATWIAYKNYGATKESVYKNFSDQLSAAKNVTIEVADTAKHFIFYDDPKWFFDKVDSFIGR